MIKVNVEDFRGTKVLDLTFYSSYASLYETTEMAKWLKKCYPKEMYNVRIDYEK